MTYTRQYPQTITADGTDIQTGFENDDNELKRIYGLLDSAGAISLAGTKRQSVLYASTLNGEPNFISASGLNVSLDGSATNILLAFAYGFDDKGAVDYINKISTLISNAWTLPSNSTVYLYIDRDISTGLISYNYSTLEDLYQKATPTATLDQHWYDLNECKMKRYNGSTWEVKQRVFVAKAVTASATTLTIYPLQSRASQSLNIIGSVTGNVVGDVTGSVTGNADTADKVNHSLTIMGNAFDGSEVKTIAAATEAQAIAGTDDATIITPLKLRNGLNAGGSAPVYACRAWVNFDGTGTPTIRASGNVSSITDNGVGNYTVNFATALPDTFYSLGGFVRSDIESTNQTYSIAASSTDTKTTSAFRFQATYASGVANGCFDTTEIDLQFFR